MNSISRYSFKFLCCICSLSLISLFCAAANAQKKDQAEFVQIIPAEVVVKDCKDVKTSQLKSPPKINYPLEAKSGKVGGTIILTVKLDEKGNFVQTENIEGPKLLWEAAITSAQKAKFSPASCDGTTLPTSAVLIFNFFPFISAEGYFAPAEVKEFLDVSKESTFYEAIADLTENYKLAFGYDDKRFYPDSPLPRADFAQFLRLTLDLLSDRAAAANKIPRSINLFYSYNPQTLTSIDAIKNIKKTSSSYDALKILLLKYNIDLANDKDEFQEKTPLTNHELLDLWLKIFGEDAIPVNFTKSKVGDEIISRGEFALFLQESLQVLTYKVLPDSQ